MSLGASFTKLAKNRKVQVGGLATAAAAGGIVWWRKRSSSSSTGTTAAGDSTGTVAGGFPDSSSTDLQDIYGQAESQIGGELDQFMTGISDLQDTLNQLQPTSPTTPSPAPPASTLPSTPVLPPVLTPTPVKPPPKVGKPLKQIKVVAYKKGQPAATPSTLSGVAADAKKQGVTVSVKQLQELNHLGNSTVIHPNQELII